MSRLRNFEVKRISIKDFAADWITETYQCRKSREFQWTGVSFQFSGFTANLDFDAFVKAIEVKLHELTFVDGDSIDAGSCSYSNGLRDVYKRYRMYTCIASACPTPLTFKTFDRISLLSSDFRVNLVPKSYPLTWEAGEGANTAYAMFVAEVAKADDSGRWELSLMLAMLSGGRYYQGGRFKLYVKKGDEIALRVYGGDDDLVTARIEDVCYNYVTLQFFIGASPLAVEDDKLL